ncbi:MAG: hypothetical protein ABR551_04275 [Gemmatimonadales bacterium]
MMQATTTLLALVLAGGGEPLHAAHTGILAATLSASSLARSPDAEGVGSGAQSRDANTHGAAQRKVVAPTRAEADTVTDPTRGLIIRGAMIGAILGALIGLLGGAAVGAVLDGVIRSLP